MKEKEKKKLLYDDADKDLSASETGENSAEDDSMPEDGDSEAVAKKKNVFAVYKEDFKYLDKKHRLKFFVSFGILFCVLLSYTIYCITTVAGDMSRTLDKYVLESDRSEIYDKYDPQQVEWHDKLLTVENPIYCNVLVGSRIYDISNINTSGNSYNASIEIWFTFIKQEFEDMFTVYKEHARVPDAETAHYYPGSISGPRLMFTIGNGSIVPNSMEVINELLEYEKENGDTYCYQKLRFDVTIGKSFDSVRYPLESLQFKIYIQPTMDAEYIRYIPDLAKNSKGECISGLAPYFGISGGFRPLKETDDINNFNLRRNYYQDINNDPSVDYDHSYKTQLEITVRANRKGIGLFLQAFINLFAVMLWMLIAFFDTSVNKEPSVGMFGTGLFGAISSILVGLQLISDATIFSLITMINLFTLAVILIMTFQTIQTKQVYLRKDKMKMAYKSVYLKTTLASMCIFVVLMFLVLPLSSYLFML